MGDLRRTSASCRSFGKLWAVSVGESRSWMTLLGVAEELERAQRLTAADAVDEMQRAAEATRAAYNSFNFDRMMQYTHEDFVKPCVENAQGLTHLLLQFLAASSALRSLAPEDRDWRVSQCFAHVYAWLMHIFDADFVWEYAMVQAVILRAVTKGSTRGGVEQKNTTTVATACGAQHIWEERGEFIQKVAAFSPKSDKLLEDVAEEDLLFHRQSENEIALHRKEMLGYLRERMSLVAEVITPASTHHGSTQFNEATPRAQKKRFKQMGDVGSSRGAVEDPAEGPIEGHPTEGPVVGQSYDPGPQPGEDVWYLYEVLFTVLENPNNDSSIKKVLEWIGIQARVEGFVDNPVRRWAYVCADQGASSSCMKFLDENRGDSRFGNLRYILSGGHEAHCYQKVVLKLLLDAGYDAIDPAFSFKSIMAVRALFRGFDNHICNNFVFEVARPAATHAFIHKFIEAMPPTPADSAGTGASSSEEASPTEALYDWVLENRERDAHFRSHTLLALEVLTAYSMVIKGMRLCRKDAAIRDLFEFIIGCSPEVRADRSKHFSIGSRPDNKECPDYHMENQVCTLKKFMTQNTPLGFQMACTITNCCEGFREVLYGQAGKAIPRSDQTRTQPVLRQSIRLAGRQAVSTLDGKNTLSARTDLPSLLSAGDSALELRTQKAVTNAEDDADHELAEKIMEAVEDKDGREANEERAGEEGADAKNSEEEGEL
ncbi:hypothetical protein B484DRAFT_397998 [Ochromonadaceae sp. CCMP2298]|nr:hypothetical protein B484DRAFT_397998 [Ochromonadaceae sp. CCMP2298]